VFALPGITLASGEALPVRYVSGGGMTIAIIGTALFAIVLFADQLPKFLSHKERFA
jgi:hypothetical protein